MLGISWKEHRTNIGYQY